MKDDFSDFEFHTRPQDQYPVPNTGKPNASALSSAFPFVQVGDLDIREPEFLVDGLLETETMSLVFGDPGCGKSFLAVDLALSVASGTAFHGREVKKGAVFFIAGEGHNGLARRFNAWSLARDVDLANVPLFKSERAAHFLDGESAKAVKASVENLAYHYGGSPALIIIDTLARNFGPGDENQTKDMSEFVAAVDDLKAQFPGCCVLIVHHSGHAEKTRSRGSMALKGALDAEFRVEKRERELKLINTKMKDAEAPPDLFFTFRQIEITENAKSAVLEGAEAPERQEKTITQAQQLGMDTLVKAASNECCWEGGEFRGVPLDTWRPDFYAAHTADGTEAKKKAFQRIRSDLVKAKKLAVENDVYRPTCPDTQMLINGNRMLDGNKNTTPGQAGHTGT